MRAPRGVQGPGISATAPDNVAYEVFARFSHSRGLHARPLRWPASTNAGPVPNRCACRNSPMRDAGDRAPRTCRVCDDVSPAGRELGGSPRGSPCEALTASTTRRVTAAQSGQRGSAGPPRSHSWCGRPPAATRARRWLLLAQQRQPPASRTMQGIVPSRLSRHWPPGTPLLRRQCDRATQARPRTKAIPWPRGGEPGGGIGGVLASGARS
jgi:hypothetical protein